MKRHIPNILTTLNLTIGCMGIYEVFVSGRAFALYYVIVTAILDFFDGFVARALNVKSEFGKQLDSLADVISFGLLPAFFMLNWIGEHSYFNWIALLIAVFSAVRLAKFNTDDSQSDSFEGLPTPANAIMITSLSFLDFEPQTGWLFGICIISSLLLVSKLRLIALKFGHFRWKGNESRWVLIAGSLVLFLILKETFIPFLIPFYLLLSSIEFVISRRKN